MKASKLMDAQISFVLKQAGRELRSASVPEGAIPFSPVVKGQCTLRQSGQGRDIKTSRV